MKGKRKGKRERKKSRGEDGEREREKRRKRILAPGEQTPCIRVCLALLAREETSVGRLSAAKFTAAE